MIKDGVLVLIVGWLILAALMGVRLLWGHLLYHWRLRKIRRKIDAYRDGNYSGNPRLDDVPGDPEHEEAGE